MRVILKQSATDNDMIEVITKTKTGTTMLWAVFHKDFLQDEDIQHDFEAENYLEVEMTSTWDLKKVDKNEVS
jgi:hypothetical protein